MGRRWRITHGIPAAAMPTPRIQLAFFGASASTNSVQRSALRHGRRSHAFHSVLRSPYGRMRLTLARLAR
jgi:hypothetical protein